MTSIGVDTLISWTSIRQLVKKTKKQTGVLKQVSFIFIRVACFGQVWSECLWLLLLSPSEEFQMMAAEAHERAPYIQ